MRDHGWKYVYRSLAVFSPWVSSKFKQDIRQRDYYLKKARKTSRDEDWLNYRASRNRVTKNIRKAKQAYNKRLVESYCGDEKAFWKTMKKILPGERKSAATSSAIQLNGETCTDNLKIANGFNSFFASVASRLMQSLRGGGSPSRSSRRMHLADRPLPEFKFDVVTEEFTAKALKNLKASKASGLDNISPRLLKDSTNVIAQPLTRILNASLIQVVVPSDWKCSMVTPLFKKGDAADMDNYRPISVLSVVSKVLESRSRL